MKAEASRDKVLRSRGCRWAIAGINACVLACFVLLHSSAQADDEKPLVILFSNSSNGILKACYCPNSPWGGLAKRAWLIRQIRSLVGSENVLLLDGGDLFSGRPDPERVLFVMRAYDLMQYHAVAIGDQEITDGLEGWRALQERYTSANPVAGRFPWLSSGYRIVNGPMAGEFMEPPGIMVETAGHRAAILSVVGESAYRFVAEERLAGLKLTDPAEMIAQFVDIYRSQSDVRILLSHQGIEADRALAAQIEGIDVIIGGHSQSLVAPPEVVNDTFICQAGKNGENLGILVLIPEQSEGRAREEHAAPGGTPASPFETTQARTTHWRARLRFVPLDASVDESPEAFQIVTGYYELFDKRLRASVHAAHSSPTARTGASVRIVDPVQETVIRAGETQRFLVRIENVGDESLKIERLRSKIRWLEVIDFPETIAPLAGATATLELHADRIDRFFRSEYSLTSNDKAHPVVHGTINGRVEGPLPGVVDVEKILGEVIPGFCDALRARSTAPHGSGQAHTEQNVEASSGAPRGQPDATVSHPSLQHVGTLQVAQSRETQASTNAIASAATHPVLVEFFYAAGCEECREMKTEVLPELQRRFGRGVEIHQFDIYNTSNYVRLARLQEELKVRTNAKVSVYVDRRIHIGGLSQIRKELFDSVEASSTTAVFVANAPEKGEMVGIGHDHKPQVDIVTERARSFTTVGVLLAGLLDGVNPCAFATIVFFVSLLSVSKKRGKDLALIAVAFCVAAYLTYFLIGLGLFRFFVAMRAYVLLSVGLRWLMVCVLCVLSVISFRDSWVFSRERQARAVLLQLPAPIKRRIHLVMRHHLGTRSLVVGAVSSGVVVTLLESVCTGQVYVPTLVYVSRQPELQPRALYLLALYNLMFIVPLAIIFFAAYRGATSSLLVKWSSDNVVWSKCLLGVFFAFLAGVMLLV